MYTSYGPGVSNTISGSMAGYPSTMAPMPGVMTTTTYPGVTVDYAAPVAPYGVEYVPQVVSQVAAAPHTAVVSAMAPIETPGYGVWPPPPLPPVSFEVAERIESLELQRSVATETIREKEEEYRLLVNARDAQWQERVDTLEARLRADDLAMQRRLEEARSSTEMRIRDELSMELMRSERRIAELEDERSASRRESGSLRMEVQMANDELIRELNAVRLERDQLANDMQHLKNANNLRSKEAEDLRHSLQEERNANQLLHKELETLKAEFEALAARNKLDNDVDIMRHTSSSVNRIISPRVSQGMIDIDLTTSKDLYPARPSTQQVRVTPGTSTRVVNDVVSPRRSSDYRTRSSDYSTLQRPIRRISGTSPRLSTTSPRVSTTFVEIDQASMSS